MQSHPAIMYLHQFETTSIVKSCIVFTIPTRLKQEASKLCEWLIAIKAQEGTLDPQNSTTLTV
jgi:hypothetical protein